MTDLAAQRLGYEYELALAGSLGPAFRTAFRPCRVTATQTSTVVRTEVPADVGLADLLASLIASGLDVEAIVQT